MYSLLVGAKIKLILLLAAAGIITSCGVREENHSASESQTKLWAQLTDQSYSHFTNLRTKFEGTRANEHIKNAIKNPMDPHYPTSTPFMEGWYTKITYKDQRIAVILGLYSGHGGKRQGYVAVLTAHDGRLHVDEEFTDEFDIKYNRPGNLKANFKVTLGDVATISEDYIQLSMSEGLKLNAAISNKTPWKPMSLGLGPESVGVFMPFKAHWFVHSLNSTVTFDYSNPKLNKRISGTGYAHQEKNWGEAFPSGWIWAQGASSDGKYQFALAGGELDIAGQKAYLIGIRSNGRSYTFHPTHSISKMNRFPCQGSVVLKTEGLTKKLIISIDAPFSSFAPLSVPTEKGFVHGAVESFEGKARVVIKGGPFKSKILEDFTISKSALEFGGDYQCQ